MVKDVAGADYSYYCGEHDCLFLRCTNGGYWGAGDGHYFYPHQWMYPVTLSEIINGEDTVIEVLTAEDMDRVW